MSDKRFFRPEGPFALAVLAENDRRASWPSPSAPASLSTTSPTWNRRAKATSAFSATPRHAPAFAVSHAGVIVTSQKAQRSIPTMAAPCLLAADPRLAFAEWAGCSIPPARRKSFIHARAIVAASARIGEDCAIAAGAVIGENVDHRRRAAASAPTP